jgi:hypothetical protein
MVNGMGHRKGTVVVPDDLPLGEDEMEEEPTAAAPKLVHVDAANTTMTVTECAMPVPTVGCTFTTAGRASLADMRADPAVAALIPDILKDVEGKVGFLELFDDNLNSDGQHASRMHSMLRVTRVPDDNLRVEICDCGTPNPAYKAGDPNSGPATKPLRPAMRTSILRDGHKHMVPAATWFELLHEDLVTFLPKVYDSAQNELVQHTVMQFRVQIPLPEPQPVSDADRPHTIKLVLPGECFGLIIGAGGRTINAIKEEYGTDIVVAPREAVYPGGDFTLGLSPARQIMITGTNLDNLFRCVENVLQKAKIAPAKGLQIVIPTSALSRLEGDAKDGFQRMRSRIPGVTILLKPVTPASTKLQERLLLCTGAMPLLAAVVRGVASKLGPIHGYTSGVDYNGLEDQKPKPPRSRNVPPKSSKAQRDKSANRGHRHTSNKLIKKAQHHVRSVRAHQRGGTGRKGA